MLGTVLEQTKEKYELTVVAGAAGLYRSLRWLYFSEDIENADFFRGGELVVLTGFSLGGAEHMERFVRMLIARNACGIIVNVGKYILPEDISPEVIALCEAEEFPLITMPWKYHLTDILHDYSRQIFFRTHEQERLRYLFQMLLGESRLFSAEDEVRLLSHEFDPAGDYRVAVLTYRSRGAKQSAPETILEDMSLLAENHLNPRPETVCVFPYRSQVLFIYHLKGEAQIEEGLREILERLERAFPRLAFFCGLGSRMRGITQLQELYQRAGAALYHGIYRDRSLSSFEEMEIFQLFFACKDPAILRGFTEILAPLEEYDRKYGGQLSETLRCYLRFQGSVSQVAEAMYCHRNTTNYRIKKIKALLRDELDSSEIRFRLQLAYYVREYLNLYQKESD